MDELIESIYSFNAGLPEELVDIKLNLMKENLFRFFRGTCHLFFDMWVKQGTGLAGPLAWISGDLHLENFGSYRAANQMVYFDLNDFDEAVLAPAHWEVVRTLSSIFIAFAALNIPPEKAERMAQLFLKSYTCTLSTGKSNYADPRTATGIVQKFLKAVEKRKYRELLRKRTGKTGRIASFDLAHPKHEKLPLKDKKELLACISKWIGERPESPNNFKPVDVVFRLAGTGSMGLDRYAFLLKSNNKKERYLLVDMKEVRRSSLYKHVQDIQPAFQTDGERVVWAQQMMQNMSPRLLSTLHFGNKEFLVQELQPTKDNIDFKLLKNRYRDMCRVIADMGMLTASAQLRASGRRGAATADELIEFAKEESWQKEVLAYARGQVEVHQNLYDQFYKVAAARRA